MKIHKNLKGELTNPKTSATKPPPAKSPDQKMNDFLSQLLKNTREETKLSAKTCQGIFQGLKDREEFVDSLFEKKDPIDYLTIIVRARCAPVCLEGPTG